MSHASKSNIILYFQCLCQSPLRSVQGLGAQIRFVVSHSLHRGFAADSTLDAKCKLVLTKSMSKRPSCSGCCALLAYSTARSSTSWPLASSAGLLVAYRLQCSMGHTRQFVLTKASQSIGSRHSLGLDNVSMQTSTTPPPVPVHPAVIVTAVLTSPIFN